MLRYRRILSFRFNIFQCTFTFLALLSAQIVLSQNTKATQKGSEGKNHFDASQNIKIKDRKVMKNIVSLMKLDCGNICNTSYSSEHILHKGNTKFYFCHNS